MGGGEASEQWQWQPQGVAEAGMQPPGGLGTENQQIQLARGRLGDGEPPSTGHGACVPQHGLLAGLSSARGP